MKQFKSHFRLTSWAGLAPSCNVKRRGKKRSIIAIAIKILVAIYHMFSTGEVWNPIDLASVEKLTKIELNITLTILSNLLNNYFL